MLDALIPQRHLKIFGNAVQCLARIGKDLFIEADQEHFVLRALNDSKSAFSAFSFRRDEFFENYECGEEDGTSVSCKLTLKALQHVLKSLKRVLSLRIYMDETAGVEPHLVMDMQCEVGILKRHHFTLQECEVTQALFDREGASYLSSTANHLMQLLEHIHGSYEVAFLANAEQICIKTFRNDEKAGASVSADAPGSARLSTEMNVSSTDFADGFIFAGQEGDQAGLVFSVREVKAFLNFCEACEAPPVTFYYHNGGRPVLFSLEDGAVMSVELVLATMEPEVAHDHLTVTQASSSRVSRGGAGSSSGGRRKSQQQQQQAVIREEKEGETEEGKEEVQQPEQGGRGGGDAQEEYYAGDEDDGGALMMMDDDGAAAQGQGNSAPPSQSSSHRGGGRGISQTSATSLNAATTLLAMKLPGGNSGRLSYYEEEKRELGGGEEGGASGDGSGEKEREGGGVVSMEEADAN